MKSKKSDSKKCKFTKIAKIAMYRDKVPFCLKLRPFNSYIKKSIFENITDNYEEIERT